MGKERCVYSWRLDHNDATPKGKHRTLSLREMEKKNSGGSFRADCNKWRKYDSAGNWLKNIYQPKPVSDLLQLQDTEQLSIY